ncbi:MAG: hypothetical protein ACP5GZ_08555 [Vulcanisaeta sp.]|uniref:hypothetical protein n=1 Tax=Vulcanisaeta sp. TaxID=2020871 RepID=UPI003D118AFA
MPLCPRKKSSGRSPLGKSSSWVRRALTRFESGSVRELGEGIWVVRGDPRLGDKYPNYVVRLKDGRYQCSCFETGGACVGRVKYAPTSQP